VSLKTKVQKLERRLAETEVKLKEISATLKVERETKSEGVLGCATSQPLGDDKINTEQSRPEIDETEETIVEVISSTCWYLPGKIGKTLKDLLVDSGSTYTIIDIALYDMIPDHEKSPLRDVQLKLRSANGALLHIHGEATVELTIGNYVFKQTVKVVSLGDKSAILGLDFMTEHDCTLHLSQGIMHIGSKSVKVKLHKLTDLRCARVQVSETVSIPARHEIIVPGRINKAGRLFEGTLGTIENTENLAEEKGICVAKALVDATVDLVPVRLANLSDNTVTLAQGHTIALLHPVESVHDHESLNESGIDPSLASINETADQSDDGDVTLPEHLQSMVDDITDRLSQPETYKVKRLLLKYENCFMGPDGVLGETDIVTHKIDTGNARPIKQKVRLPPVQMQDEVDKEIDKLLANGVIEPSTSAWSSPVVAVRKKDGSLRLCTDFRKINAVLVNKDAYPLPKISDCLDALSGACWFSALDLAAGYNQVAMDPESKEKTAFSVKRGLFQYRKMPFGMANSPSTFERLMEIVLSGLQYKICVLYLDDILTFSTSVDQMIENLEEVFQRFKKANLKLKPSKCKLFQRSVDFLGHVVSAEGVSCDPKKIEAVQNWPKPKNVKDVRSFTGFCQYYRKFVKGFSTIAAPLYALTQKNAKFRWTDECDLAFNTLKEKLVTAPVLAYPTRNDEFILDCDASLYGVGGVLSQIQDGVERPIAYASATLSKCQQNYCTTMRELLSVVIFVKQFHHFLWGRKFRIRTDHASLTWLVSFKEPAGMLARWISILGNYDYSIEHRKGGLHVNADALSRKVSRKCKREDCESCALNLEQCVCVVSPCHIVNDQDDEHLEDLSSDEESVGDSRLSDGVEGQNSVVELCHGSERDLSTNEFLVDSPRKSDMSCSETVVQTNSSDSEDGSKVKSDVGEVGDVCVLTRNQRKKLSEGTDVPAQVDAEQQQEQSEPMSSARSSRMPLSPNWVDSWSVTEIREMQHNDEVLAKVMKLKKARNDPPDKDFLSGEDNEMKILCSQWYQLELHDDILYRRWISENPREPVLIQIVVPQALRKDILHLLHSHKTSGHLGIAKTLGKLRQRFYWPGHKSDVIRWCTQCKICERVNISLNPKRAPLQSKPVYGRMERVAIDIMNASVESENGNLYILVVADYFTKFTEAYAIPSMTAQVVADKFVTEWVCRYGCPTVLHSDQGRQFESELFQELCRLLDIHKTRTSRYRPQSDAVVERNNRTIKKMLRSLVEENVRSWDEYLPYAMMAFRASIHVSTKCSPNLLLFGSENRLPVDLVFADGLTREVSVECPCLYVEWVRGVSRDAFSKAREHLKKNVERQKRLYDRNSFLRTFKVGDWVWVLYPPELQSKLGKGWIGPFLVIKRLGEVNYVVQRSPDSKCVTLHVDHMKVYLHKDTPQSWVNPPEG
jgi:transposase InsO family protein